MNFFIVGLAIYTSVSAFAGDCMSSIQKEIKNRLDIAESIYSSIETKGSSAEGIALHECQVAQVYNSVKRLKSGSELSFLSKCIIDKDTSLESINRYVLIEVETTDLCVDSYECFQKLSEEGKTSRAIKVSKFFISDTNDGLVGGTLNCKKF